MWKYLNKGISTPIAIGIILILAILVGSFTWRQYAEIRKEETNVPEVQIPEKEETTGSSSEFLATEDWNIYRNKEYGFEVTYPILEKLTYYKEGENGHYLEEIKNGASISVGEVITPEKDYWGGVLEKNPSLSKDPKLWLKEVDKLGGAPSAPVFLNELTIDGHKAIKAEGGYISGAETYVFIGGDKAIYVISISYSAFSKKDKENYNQVLDQMLSTFRFID